MTDLSAAGVYTDLQGLSSLRRAAREESPEALRETARQFEGLFLQMMLKSMREALPGDGLIDSEQLKLYQGMFDKQVALDLAKGGAIGLADVLYRQLGGEEQTPRSSRDLENLYAAPVSGGLPDVGDRRGQDGSRGPDISSFEGHRWNYATTKSSGAILHLSPAGVSPKDGTNRDRGSVDPSPSGAVDWSQARQSPQGPGPAATGAVEAAEPGYDASPAHFVTALWPEAAKAGTALGVAPEVLIAQSALETGWGRRVIRDPEGRSSHNLFGIKAGPGWPGPSAGVSSLEYETGVAVRRQARFRVYDSAASSFADYVRFVGGNPRYRAALARAQDPGAYVQGLQDAGYATDPRYAEKIKSILSGSAFVRQVATLKVSAIEPITQVGNYSAQLRMGAE